MRKNIGIILLLISLTCLGCMAFFYFRVGFFLKPPHEKLLVSWREDVQLLEESKKLPKEWGEIREITINSDNSPVHDWLDRIKPPIQKNPRGKYRLEAFLNQWIEGYRYGVVIQYKLIDMTNSNTVWELGRTYKLGFQY